MSERELLHTDRVLVVEGKYDAARLSHLTDAMILLTDGFGIYKDKKRQQLLKALAKKNGLILFTDSDAAGFRIRTYITNLVGAENVVQAYVPAIHGKEKRKPQPGKEGLLGVEGVDDAIVLQCLRDALGAEAGAAPTHPEGRQITYTDLYNWGLSGTPGSAERKYQLLNALGLPPRLSKKELVEALNRLYSFEQLDALQIPAAQDVTLKELAFSYGEEPVFSGLSLTAHPGDIIGITGPVACGKSTLGRVFLCEAPYQGSVCFGGRELSALTPRQIAATVGYLGHDPELSADTVQNNVLCGSEQDAMPWLAAAALKEEVLAMEKGTETVIGSGGTRLSGGQAQRLALARTLAHPRPVLVLDDPFSALDRSTEDAIFAELQAYARDKVVFLISHRLYHFPQMQQIIFMEGGRTTVGTHEELMAAVPVYRQLYESQTGLKGGEGA